MSSPKISVVIPVFNEEKIIEKLAIEIEKYIEYPLEFVFINDGSSDSTIEILKKFNPSKKSTQKKIVDLTRNFGHQPALMAGLSSVSEDSDMILVMDADFQDSPEDIPKLINKLKDGYDCVYAVRDANSGNRLINKLTKIFYKMQKSFLRFSIPQNAGTFSVFTKNFLHKILNFKETEIYFPGLRAYIGLNQTGVPVKRGMRASGKSKVGTMGLINLSMAGIVGFSIVPMRSIFLFGVLMTIFCFCLGFIIFLMKIIGITKVMGVTTVLIFMLGLFGIQIMFIGIVGEYLESFSLKQKNAQHGSSGKLSMINNYYDKDKHKYMQYQNNYFAEFIFSIISDNSFSSYDTAIELGAGMGRFSAPIIQNFNKVTLIEPVSEYTDILKKKFPASNVNIITSSAEAFLTDPMNRKPAIVFCFHLMHHLTYEQRKTIYQYIKKTGSKCVLVEPNPYNLMILIQTLLDPDMKFTEEKQYLTLTHEKYKKEIEKIGLALTAFKRFCFVPPIIANSLLQRIPKYYIAQLEILNSIFPFISSYQQITYENIA